MSVQLFEPLNIYIMLVGVEVWTDRDRISVLLNDTAATLNNFLAYRRSNINPKHYNDNAQLITYAASLVYRGNSLISICLHGD